MVDDQTAAVNSCEICVSNILTTDTVDKLTAIFESERITGLADCTVDAVTFSTNDSTCAVVRFTDQKGCTDDRFFNVLLHEIVFQV